MDMGIQEGIYYVLIKNPVSEVVIDSMKSLTNTVLFKGSTTSSVASKVSPALENLQVSTLVRVGSPFVSLAGICGSTAVILGAYGVHTFYTKEGYEDRKRIYQTANTYHFMHSLALLGVPLCRYPVVAGSFFSLGMLLFCGTCYFHAFTGRLDFRNFTPVGGACLILGWLSLLF